jgi:hypothetical protein
VVDTQRLALPAPCCRQTGMDMGRSQPALCRHLARGCWVSWIKKSHETLYVVERSRIIALAIRGELIEERLQGYSSPQDLLGEEGLFKELKKRLQERALGGELTEYLG